MKQIVKSLVRFFGFEVKRIPILNENNMFRMRQTMKDALQHIAFLDYYPDTIIDVGAADATLPLLEIYPKSKFIFIEPLLEFEPALKKLKEKYNAEYIIAGAGKTKNKIILNVHPDLVSSSILHESDGKDADGIPREINVFPLDDLLSEGKITGTVLLKIDAQGAEIDILSGASKLLPYCDVVILEVPFFRFLKNVPEFHDVIAFMKNCEFVVYDLFDGHNRPLDNALAQKDILFVKENGLFRKNHHWATKEQRKRINGSN